MHVKKSIKAEELTARDESLGAELLHPLMERQPGRHTSDESSPLVAVGQLVAVTDEGRIPLVVYPGQEGSAAVRARTVIDLHGAHIGRRVVLMFEGGDFVAPIVMGVLRDGSSWPLTERTETVKVDADGERLVVTAKEQIVLRCGKASITLTKAGKVLIRGTYVLSQSSGANRIKGGSVQLN